MLNNILLFGNSKLRPFCNESYSIELFFILLSNKKNKLGIEEIYNKLTLPKPKQTSVDSYIKFLTDKGFVKQIDNVDKRKKTLVLSEKSILEFNKLKKSIL